MKKIIWSIAMCAMATVFIFNVTIGSNKSNESVTLDGIMTLAHAQEGEIHTDKDRWKFWDKIWDNTFNLDWAPTPVDCFDREGNFIGTRMTCPSGDADSCYKSDCNTRP